MLTKQAQDDLIDAQSAADVTDNTRSQISWYSQYITTQIGSARLRKFIADARDVSKRPTFEDFTAVKAELEYLDKQGIKRASTVQTRSDTVQSVSQTIATLPPPGTEAWSLGTQLAQALTAAGIPMSIEDAVQFLVIEGGTDARGNVKWSVIKPTKPAYVGPLQFMRTTWNAHGQNGASKYVSDAQMIAAVRNRSKGSPADASVLVPTFVDFIKTNVREFRRSAPGYAINGATLYGIHQQGGRGFANYIKKGTVQGNQSSISKRVLAAGVVKENAGPK